MVRDFEERDHPWAQQLLAAHSGGTHLVARLGELIDPLTLEGLVAVADDGRAVGLATCKETPDALEIVTLHADPQGQGAGSLLLRTALQVAAVSDHRRLWLVTTNDNLPAIRFYLRRGMHVATIHRGAVDADRRLKPQIPTANTQNGLPIRDLIEFELEVAVTPPDLPTRVIPGLADLNLVPVESFAEALAPAFEGAPQFLRRLAEARPFDSDGEMLDAARAIARRMPEPEQIELLDAHPRIGADPSSVSALSRVEQGYGGEAPPVGVTGLTGDVDAEPGGEEVWERWAAAQPVDPWVADELAALNDAYEARFGFRYVVFVAGRPRREFIPLLERALSADRDEELRRGLDDVIHIAADRLAKLRGSGS